MPARRILSLWFPRLAAERILRAERGLCADPLAVVTERANALVLVSLSAAAEAEGLRRLQPLRDAQAACPRLVTRPAAPAAEAAFLAALRRWAGRFSPWVAEEPPEGLVIDITGCAHLFGGEAALVSQVEAEATALGLSLCSGLADTVGAAWALARYAGRGVAAAPRSADAIDMEAPATRSRAARRPAWTREAAPASGTGRVAAPGQTRAAIAALPVAALRLPAEDVARLARLGLRRIDDLAGQPRAGLARRFGTHLVRRLDQALGAEPEPVAPARPPAHFAVRLTLPEPIGREDDLLAVIDRLLPRLEERLREKGRGARRLRLDCFRVDQSTQAVEVGLARPTAESDRLRPLLAMKLDAIEAGYGIDAVRLEASVTEPVYPAQQGVVSDPEARALEDLIGRLGARIGLDAITRLHPADSHIPEKTTKVLAAAWSEPAGPWPVPPAPRPLQMWRPEPVMQAEGPRLPESFRWRGRVHVVQHAEGPERIAPEWWLDEPEWRSGVRDYWRVTTEAGERLWLFYAHGAAMSAGWFCHGRFA